MAEGLENSGGGKGLTRKRLHPGKVDGDYENDEAAAPKAKRSPEGIYEEEGEEVVEERPASTEPRETGEEDLLLDLPAEALKAASYSQFVNHMRPYAWVKFPSATAAEVNALIKVRWNVLKKAPKTGKGSRRRSELEHLTADLIDDVEDTGNQRPSRQRAAKQVAKNAYTMDVMEELDYMDSPASSLHSSHSRGDTGSSIGGSGKKDKKKASRSKRLRKGRASGLDKDDEKEDLEVEEISRKAQKPEQRVPPMKIKMIGRSRESDSPIFLAESVESWDEGSGNEKGSAKKKRKGRKDLMKMKERELAEGESGQSSPVVLPDEEIDEEEDEEEEVEEEEMKCSDSEGEHADYCHTCKDGGELLCCDFCPLAYHLKCLVPPMESIPNGDWSCPRCGAAPLDGKIEKIHTWRWKEMVVDPRGEERGSELEDDVIEEDGAGKTRKLTTYKIREFFVKWHGKSYWKNSWVSEIRIDVHQPMTLRFYMRRHNMDVAPKMELPPHVQRRHKRRSATSLADEKMEEQEIQLLKAGVRPQWLQVHRVINKRSTRRGSEYLVKWRDQPYSHATWEKLGEDCGLKGAPKAIQEYDALRRHMDPKKRDKRDKKRRKAKSSPDPISRYEEQPAFISSTGGKLHPYQMEGLNWLRFSWSQHTNTILADEMGLGKTIQTICFIYSLFKEGHTTGPFLISAPLSTIINWEREFEFWAPDLYVVTYNGDKDNRAAIRENEFTFVDGAIKKSNNRLFKLKEDTPLKFHVLLTSYEYITVDNTLLSSIDWQVLVVDEAHRLKNNQSKFFRILSGYELKCKLLLTGTPLQNNLEELFHLLNFLNPVAFDSLEQFQEEFEDISKEDQVSKLHDLLGPHLLRRLKADVLKNIPPKRELIVRVDLSPMQKKFYRWILTRNFEKLNSRGSQAVSLLNIMMDLKKCCNHPYLFPTASQEAPLTSSGYYQGRELIQASGKFMIMEKMFKRLREQGHRILVFSQMTRMLDIMEDFLEHMGYKFERIDGNVTGPERQQSIDRFNSPKSEQFVFLLSTRAGGLGINLATADTVIIYDSDWNPHNDIQAFSRAHRIGQSNKVMIYRFVTRSSVEERITEVAKKKMMLTHLVVRPGMGSGGAAPSLSKRELDDILRFGTEDLFKDETSDTAIHYDNKTIEALLDREQEGDSVDVPGSENLLANEYLSSFKVASYVTKEVGEEEEEEPETEILKEASDQPDPDFWEKLLRHHYEQQRELEEAKLGKGKRVRKQVNYLDVSEDRAGRDSDQSSYQQSDERDTESESDGTVEYAPGRKTRGGKFKKIGEGLPPLLAKVNGVIYVLGFNPRQRKGFLNSVMRYGMPPPDAYNSTWKMRELKAIPEKVFNGYVNLFMRHLCEPELPNSSSYSDGVPREPVSRQNILTRIGIMRLVRNKVEQYSGLNGDFSVPEDAVSSTPTPTIIVEEAKPLETSLVNQDGVLVPTSESSIVKEEIEDEATPSGKSSKRSSPESSLDGTSSSSSSSSSSSLSGTSSVKETTPMSPGAATPALAVNDEPEAMEVELSGEGGDNKVEEMGHEEKMEETKLEEKTGETETKLEEPKTKSEEPKMETDEPKIKTEEPKIKTEEPKKETEEPKIQPEEAKSEESSEVKENESSITVTKNGSIVKPEKSEGAGPTVIANVNVQESKPASVIVYNKKEGPSEKKDSKRDVSGKGSVKTLDKKWEKKKFMFNIADGGFTELHSLWADEKTKGFDTNTWGRHHDYWLLKGLITHGYCRWSEICTDIKYSLLNKPFGETSMTDNKSRFLLRRFKLLEQALAVEEQLHRASNARLYQDPNHAVMQLHSRFTDLDCLADGHTFLVADCLTGDKNSILLMKKALTKMEELLMEMKLDVTRLPGELSKMPSVSVQLKMDEYSTISKLAKGNAQSVITQAPPKSTSQTTPTVTDVSRSKSPNIAKKEQPAVVEKKQHTTAHIAAPVATPLAQNATKYQVAYTTATGSNAAGTQVQLPAGSGLAVQTAQGNIVVYSVASSVNTTQTVSIVQGGTVVKGASTQLTNSSGQTYTIGVPAFIDGSNLYQTVQLVPSASANATNIASGSQVVYWPSTASNATVGPSQIAVVPQGQVLQSVQFNTKDGSTTASKKTSTTPSVITID